MEEDAVMQSTEGGSSDEETNGEGGEEVLDQELEDGESDLGAAPIEVEIRQSKSANAVFHLILYAKEEIRDSWENHFRKTMPRD